MSSLREQLEKQKAAKLATEKNGIRTVDAGNDKNIKPNPLANLFPSKKEPEHVEPKPSIDVPTPTKIETKSALPSFLRGSAKAVVSAPVANGTGPKNPTIPTPSNVTVKPKVELSLVIPENIPEEQRINVEELKTNIDFLVAHIDDAGLVKDVIRNILVKVNKNPDLAVFVPSELVNIVVRGARAAYKHEALRATEKKEKKSTRSAKTDEFDKMFRDLGMEDFG